jgi:hypothetical protein
VERALGKLHAQFEYAVTDDVVDGGLHDYVDDFQTKLNALGELIRGTFFAPVVVRAPVVDQQQQ